MTIMRSGLFQLGGALAAVAWVTFGCTPRTASYKECQVPGTFMASSNRLYEDDGDFDLRKTVVYYEPKAGIDPTPTNLPTPEFTRNRCSWCHECGFKSAWDVDNFGKPEWSPRYRGEAWRPIVQRMRVMDGSLLNEQIAERIYNYLRDESLGLYQPELDAKGAVVREVDELPTNVEIKSPGLAEKERKAEGEARQNSGEATNQSTESE